MEYSQVQVYTGDGKGKTTAALGLSVRAIGAGLKVIWVSFLKRLGSSEFETMKCFEPNFKHIAANPEMAGFYWQLSAEEKAITGIDCQRTIETIYEYIQEQLCDVLVLDELMAILCYDIVSVDYVLQMMTICRERNIEVIMTGRNAPMPIIQAADLVTEMQEIKHPLGKGVIARHGIEY